MTHLSLCVSSLTQSDDTPIKQHLVLTYGANLANDCEKMDFNVGDSVPVKGANIL